MKKINSNKGFTLVEVLVVIVILGILSTIGIVSVVNIRKNQEKEFEQNQLSLFKEKAKNYFSDHKSLLPLNTESEFIVYLRDLIEENYIDSLLKYDKNSYDLDRSYVLVKRIGTEFVYEVVLCKETDASKCTLAAKPENINKAKFEFINYRKENSNTNLTKVNSNYYANKTTKFDYIITDTDGIKAVIYYVYKNGKKIGAAQTFNPGKESFSDTITINTNNYDDGKYEIEFTVYDKNDNVSTGISDTIYIDRVAPTCKIIVNGEKIDGWYKPSPTLILSYSDEFSGISLHNLSTNNSVSSYNMVQTSTQGKTDGITWYGTVEDRAGNIGKCEATLKVKKLPLCSRATQLHTEICNSETYFGCIDAGISKGATITYGTIGVNGTLASGNAFDCDVNGDGNYDATTERFYYVTDLNATTAVLIYYSNTTGGISYDSSGENWKGPVSAIKYLPTISTWSNVNLVKPIRTIKNDQGETNVNGKNLPTAFSYEGYVARLLTYQEVIAACNIQGRKIGYDDTVIGELYGCNYLLEKTQYANKNASYTMSHYWLETPTQYLYGSAWPAAAVIWANGGYVGYHPTDNAGDEGIRPVIEVLKSNMIY